MYCYLHTHLNYISIKRGVVYDRIDIVVLKREKSISEVLIIIVIIIIIINSIIIPRFSENW